MQRGSSFVIAKVRKLVKREGFWPLATIPLILLAWYFITWPYDVYQADARWIGLAFWIALLVAIVTFVTVFLFDDEWEDRMKIQKLAPEISPVDRKDDKPAFEGKVRDCLNDRSIVGYFRRNLVREDDVTEALVDGFAFREACDLDSYESFASTRSKLYILDRIIDSISLGVLNVRTATTFVGTSILIVLLFIEVGQSNLTTSGMAFVSIIFVGASSWLFSAARNKPEHRLRKLVFSSLAMCISLCIIILPPILFNIRWKSFFIMFPIWLIVLFLCYLLPIRQTLQQCLTILNVGIEEGHLLFLRDDVRQLERKWLDNCEDIIKEQANLTINTILGKDKDRLLVEQDSEGLRKLQDPSYTVSTRSEHRIASVLSQMDSASIAIAGPRGAGKSTLLRKFSGPLRSNIEDDPGISIYLPAPAEYIPRDFIAALFQQLCEAYLLHEQCELPKPIYKESSKFRSGHLFISIFWFLWLFVRTVILITIIAWIMRSIISTHYHDMYESVLATFRHWYDQAYSTYKSIYKDLRPYWAWIRILILIIVIFRLLSISGLWAVAIRPRREPALAKSAREYLRRLQIEKTVTWGKGASIGSLARGASLSLNRGGTASYAPWTLPELVTHTRRFMQDISEQFRHSSHAVVVGIDEIDRIGSLDHAEKFVGEIKAIFGIEKCFFLVAVAEDVGSIFAQRATVGRSILENAFDDVVLVEPLDFQETRDLLLKRVPGFTDSFVYLVHALSGGLPREVIRITRRLVDVNQEANTANPQLQLQDLAFCLVKEQLIEAIRATRNQMARLMLHVNWTIFFEKLHSASVSLRYASPPATAESYDIIKELSELTVPSAPDEGMSTGRELVIRDEDEAVRIVRDFTAFSFFGLMVIEAFSDRIFDLEAVQRRTASGSEGSYEELALARAELTVSPENSSAMLRRFRSHLPAP